MRFCIPMAVEAWQGGAAMAQGSPVAERMEQEQFQAFYQRTAPKLRAYIRRAAGDAALADDIFQEAFLRFLRTSPAGLDERQQRAYLYRTANSLLVDHWRRAKRQRLWSLLWPFQEAVQDAVAMGPDMKQMFAKLKPQEQALLWLAYVEGFEHGEIAAALELSAKSVRVLLYRARKKMAGILASQGFGPQGDL